MKKIKLLTPILGLTALAGAALPLASCSQQVVTDGVIPADAFDIKDVTLKGFKEEYDYTNYTKLVIPSNVKVIDYNAFDGAFTAKEKVTTVVIPGNVETIRKGAFTNNTAITVYDFSGLNADQIYGLTVEEGAFDLEENGIFSFVQMNDNWTEIEKETLKRKLQLGGIPTYYTVKQTKGNVEVNQESPKEQTADAGETVNTFDVKGQYGSSLQYKAILSKIDSSEGVDIDHDGDVEVSADYKKIAVSAKMIPVDGHELVNNDFVTYKITLICYSGSEETNDYKAQWSETIDTFKLIYHNVLDSIAVVDYPTKSQYRSGETFDPTGLKIKAFMSNESEIEVTAPAENLTTSLDNHVFTDEDVFAGEVTGRAKYVVEGIEKEADFSVTMLESLSSIKVTSAQTLWYVGETFDKDQIVVEAGKAVPEQTQIQWETLASNAFEVSSDIDLTKAFEEEQIGTHTVTVTYRQDGSTRTTTFDIEITKPQGYFNDIKWNKVGEACSKFEAITTPTVADAKELCQSLGVTSPTEEATAQETLQTNLVGIEGTMKINGQDHKVKIIDAMHDVDSNGKPVALTFESFTLASDADGINLSTMWDSTHKNDDYTNSSLRKALTGQGSGQLQWWHTIYTANGKEFEPISETRSLLDMIKETTPSIAANIKNVRKEVAVRQDGEFKVTKYTDKLFTLTYHEVHDGTASNALDEGNLYKFWEGKDKTLRLKTDAGNTRGAGKYFSYWLPTPKAKPDSKGSEYTDAWYSDNSNGKFVWYDTNYQCSVSFAFCI